ncbi:MAG: TIGR04563 family protein [Deltaproteobacteria bacterium]|nr:MAG: TIGR04563 family protein [Deltaproteobacteria bacterium]
MAQGSDRKQTDEGKQADKRKQSLYFPEEMLAEIKREALRQDRSLSWIVQQAWRIARDEIKKFPSINLDTDIPE